MNEKKSVKSDMPFYYGAAVILIVISCISLVVIARNVSSGAQVKTSISSMQTGDDGVKADASETESVLKISHAGMAGYDDGSEKAETEPSDALRSKK